MKLPYRTLVIAGLLVLCVVLLAKLFAGRVTEEVFSSETLPAPAAWNGIVCPQVIEPVCGRDGQTYGNRCEAERQAQVSIVHEGPCDGDPIVLPGNGNAPIV